MDNDDAALIERCRAGDLTAFEPLVEKYRQRVWRLAYNFLRDREEAWDVAQEAFIRAYQALPSFRGQSAFYTWLYRIVMNVAADRARSRGARGRAFGTERVPEEDWDRVLADQNAADEAPDAAAARREQRRKIDEALALLPEHHRKIIVLSDLEGLSYREIADTLEIPMGTVMSRLHNARKRLRDALKPLLLALLVFGALLAAAAPRAVQAGDPVVRFGARVLLGTDAPLPAGAARRPGGRRRAHGGVHPEAATAVPVSRVCVAGAVSGGGGGGDVAGVDDSGGAEAGVAAGVGGGGYGEDAGAAGAGGHDGTDHRNTGGAGESGGDRGAEAWGWGVDYCGVGEREPVRHARAPIRAHLLR